jgi:hypothetical protein
MIIKPTIGRKIWFWPTRFDADAAGMQVHDVRQALDASIVLVQSDRKVNLFVVDHAGRSHAVLDVTLRQPEDNPPPGEAQSYCEWMPFQQGQAKGDQPGGKS